jgi:aminoglycoside 3-N-acetyltransferase
VAVLSLALGIGANTAIFTLMNVAMLKSLPVSDPEALVMLTLQSGQSGWMHSRQELANGFRALGVTPGDTIMLHASVRAVGEVAGGPDQIHLALKDALTADGTLLMYASCPSYYDEVGRGALSTDEEREILEKLPPFDPLTARAQRENGALVEFLRTYPGSIVNHHVARFVVWGRHAGHLISRQPWNYAFGNDSALDRFVQLEGKILLLGCDKDNVTFLHYAEHIVDIPDKRVSRFKVPVLEDGTRVWRDMEEFDTSGAGAHHNWPDRFFARLVDTYLAQTGNRGGVVGSARSFLFDARGLLELALSTMKAVAADPRAAANLVSA